MQNVPGGQGPDELQAVRRVLWCLPCSRSRSEGCGAL